MITRLQFNILFSVGVAGAILLLIGPWLGLDVGKNPLASTGVGAILTYVLTRKDEIVKKNPKTNDQGKEEGSE